MIWLITVASLLGFLAVDTLANQPTIANNDEKSWLILVVVLTISLIHSSGLKLWIARKFRSDNQTKLSLIAQVFKVSIVGIIFILTLLLSASYGLYRYQVYQNTLLKSPLTVDATIQSHQISDNLSQSIRLSNDDFMIGSGYVRQVLQVIVDEKASDHDSTPINHQPLTALISANVKDNPEWQSTLSNLKPGQQLKVKLQLRPIQQSQTQNLPKNAISLNLGFNESLWLRQRGVQAKGNILTINQNSLSDFENSNFLENIKIHIELLRWQLRQKLLLNLSKALVKQSHFNSNSTSLESSDVDFEHHKLQSAVQNHAILLGLLTGDKSLMDSDLKTLYQVTGISHLLAISGPHVLMLASVVSVFVLWLVKLLAPKLLVKLPSSLLVLWVSVGMAGFYAMLVGFEIPAQRTFWMLLLLTIAKQFLIRISTYRLLAYVAFGMFWLDTTAVGQAGFWLSFIAVALLLKFSEAMSSNSDNELKDYSQLVEISLPSNPIRYSLDFIFTQIKQLLKLQLWLFVWMLPIVVWFFGKVSLIGIFINLFAVPFLGLIIVPLDMLAGVLSLIPIIGDWLSQTIWSVLALILQGFHFLLNRVVELGFAKQSFLALSQSQLAICILIALEWFLRGFLPRMLILPLFIVLILIPIQQKSLTKSSPTLALLGNPKISVSLLKNGDNNWLILSDNKVETAKANKPSFVRTKKTATYLSDDEEIKAILNRDILPLLANQQVNQLTGVISQTPSIQVNQLVQQLASNIPVKEYWLAGFDVARSTLTGSEDKTNASFRFITPKTCQSGKSWQRDGLEIKAIAGWNLDLPLSTDEKIATQTCFIQINSQTLQGKPFNTLILAGKNEIPLQMTEKLCALPMTDLLIQPFSLPIKQSWLAMTKPKTLHVLTGEYDSQKLAEDSRLSLASWQTNQPTQQIIYSNLVGDVVYSLISESAN